MKKILVGEYCRTETGYIAKLIEKNKDLMEFDGNIISRYGEEDTCLYSDKYWGDETEEIIKHSPNIIDLIEVGDYVNGELITAIYDENEKDEIIQLGFNNCGNYKYFTNDDVKNIVTHESFNSIKYEVI